MHPAGGLLDASPRHQLPLGGACRGAVLRHGSILVGHWHLRDHTQEPLLLQQTREPLVAGLLGGHPAALQNREQVLLYQPLP